MSAALVRWRGLLAELGAIGQSLVQASAANDIAGAIAAVAEGRRVRSAISRVELANVGASPEELGLLADLAELLEGARTAASAMDRWLARPLPPEAKLLASPLGIAALADSLLPGVWDAEIDVVVLLGDELAPVAEILAALGQRRVVLVGTASDHAVAVQTAEEASLAIRLMVPDAPLQVVVRAATGFDAVLVDAVATAARTALADLRIHRNTVREFSRTWVEQGLANLPAIGRWPSIASVGDRFAGLPMVIVAPGPSLAHNAHLLRELRGRAILVAFSHSLKPVLAAGVAPDLVLTVDPQDVRYHFAGCDLGESYLVNAATVHPSLFTLPARGCFTASANSAIDDWIFAGLGEDAQLPGGGSVATTAFSLALRWKCDPIVFVGLDLSFPGGAYYVSTSSDGGARAHVTDGLMTVEGWSPAFAAMKAGGGPRTSGERTVELPGWRGGTVPSSFMFALFHRWFEERMRSVSGVRVVNATEGGCAIAGMEHVPLAAVLETLDRSVDARAILDEVVAAQPPNRAAQLGAHFAWYARSLRRCRRLARMARSLIDRGGPAERLAAVERLLAAALRPLSFASLLAQRELAEAQDLARRADADHLAVSRALLNTLIATIDRLEPSLRIAQAALGLRRSDARAA
ncbi:MAG TPA: 6-hydroxymethylpterin diphosphokinase MptE-like protein [Kofleriaceae bacterium]|jgi:hypothetical protein